MYRLWHNALYRWWSGHHWTRYPEEAAHYPTRWAAFKAAKQWSSNEPVYVDDTACPEHERYLPPSRPVGGKARRNRPVVPPGPD